MAQVLERELVNQVADAARDLGYIVTLAPSRIPGNKTWTDGLTSFVRGQKFRPDILVESGAAFALVKVKSRPVLLGGITQTKQYADHFESAVVVCVSDDSFRRTPASVKNYANRQQIQLCPLSKIGGVLKDILG